MHSAPWPKISTSALQPAQISRTSSRLSSRASTTRSMPSAAASLAPPRVNRLICVLAWRGRSGTISRASARRPQSCTSTASTPMALARRSASAAAGSSRSVTSVFSVRKTRTPRRWQYCTADANSSSVKFRAPRRALKAPKPIYTASAPLCTAATSASYPPAGDSSSIIPGGCSGSGRSGACGAARRPRSWRGWPRPDTS